MWRALQRAVSAILPTLILSIPAPAAEFDVASLKASDTLYGTSVIVENTRVHANCSLRCLMEKAYGMRPLLIEGPSWIGTQKYMLEARFSPDQKEQVPAMLRHLLEARLHLVTQIEKRNDSVYLLRLAPGGLKVQPAKPTPPGEPAPPVSVGSKMATGLIAVRGAVSLTRLANILSGEMDRTVINETGLEQEFDLDWSGRVPSESRRMILPQADIDRFFPNRTPGEEQSPTVFSTLRQLGLKLDSGKSLVDHLIVKAADPIPIPD